VLIIRLAARQKDSRKKLGGRLLPAPAVQIALTSGPFPAATTGG
jgi:hypothetical protein